MFDGEASCASKLMEFLVRLINLFAININVHEVVIFKKGSQRIRLNGDKHSSWLHKK